MMLRRGLNGVLGQLVNEGLLTDAQLETARAAAGAVRSPTPWFVRLLVGVGAWVSAGVLVLLLALGELFDGATSMAVIGAVSYGVGLLLRRAVTSDYLVQLSLAAGLGGAAMLLWGVWALLDDTGGLGTTLAVSFLVCAATVALFPDWVMRFIGTAGACVTLVLSFQELELGPDGAVAAVAVAAGLAWHHEARWFELAWARRLQRPVAWGLVVSLLAFQLSTVTDLGGQLRVGPAATLSVALALGVLVVAVAREQRAPLASEPVLVALAAVVLLAAVLLRSPGVLAALYVSALAFHRRSPVMLGLSTVFLVGFLASFYFRLELTLLDRSLVLLASGAMLLGLREYLRRRFGPLAEEELP